MAFAGWVRCLGIDGKGKAPHWRLTELGYMRDLPTKDFLRWDGTRFKPLVTPPPPEARRKNKTPHRKTVTTRIGKPKHQRTGKPMYLGTKVDRKTDP